MGKWLSRFEALKEELVNSGLNILFINDITSEEYREYFFENGAQVKINYPIALVKLVHSSAVRVISYDREVYYIPERWVALKRKVKDNEPLILF